MRDSPALAIITALQDAGAEVRAYDPHGIDQAKHLLTGVTFAAGPYDCVTGADAAALVTEWDEFRALDLKRLKSLLKAPIVVDLRNVYAPDVMQAEGFDYTSIGPAEGD